MKGRVLKRVVAALGLVLAMTAQANTTGKEASTAATERKEYAAAGCMACHQSDDTPDERGSESE